MRKREDSLPICVGVPWGMALIAPTEWAKERLHQRDMVGEPLTGAHLESPLRSFNGSLMYKGAAWA